MRRTRNARKKERGPADAILVSDLHLTDSTPVSRTDDYMEAQKHKLQFLKSLSQENNNCPILCAGDVFDHWKASPWLCSFAFRYLPKPFIAIPGQHDLPEHSLKQWSRSALPLLSFFDETMIISSEIEGWENTGRLLILGKPYGTLKDFGPDRIPNFPYLPAYRKVLILHELVWKGRRPSWDKGKGSWTDKELLNKFGEHFDLILTGDNHEGFVTRKGNCLLVNPGSVMRRTADQANYQPRCYLYYAVENDVEPVYFPIAMGVHTREHIDRRKERDERIAAYIERMKINWEIGLSFKKNLESYLEENSVPQKVREIIWQHLETI